MPIAAAGFGWPLALSTLAGCSTSVGGYIGVMRKPSQRDMSYMLGLAIGVMMTVSVVELVVKNAIENDALKVCASAIMGALTYYVLEPLVPRMEGAPHGAPPKGKTDLEQPGHVTGYTNKDSLQSKSAKRPSDLEHSGQETYCVSSGGDSDPHNAQMSAVAHRKKALSARRNTPTNIEVDARADVVASGTSLMSPRQREELAAAATPLPAAYGGVLYPQDSSSGGGSRSNGACIPTVTGADAQISSLAQQGVEQQGALSVHSVHSTLGLQQQQDPQQRPLWQQERLQQQQQQQQEQQQEEFLPPSHPLLLQQRSAGLLRLGVLMTITMTLHNMPEGFAVAFSAYTHIGPLMAVAIAMHNVPEGIIIAAPIFAATGSRWKALGWATASGLSEPLGALLALLVLHPFITPERLQYLLAAVGGLMLAVCVIELWPEGRACKHNWGLGVGIAVGTVIMGGTLCVE